MTTPGGSTAQGYPYPLGSEMVRDGDNAIKALADANQARVPIRRGYWFRGGLTTNQYGGIAITVGFTVAAAIAITAQPGYACAAPSGAPANTLWVDVWGTNGALVPNTFIIFNIIAWGM